MRYVFLMLSVFAFSASAKINIDECISVHGDVGKAMLLSMVEDLGVNRNSVMEGKTKTKIIKEEPVSLKLAQLYGAMEKKLSGENSEDKTTIDEYAHGFMLNNSKNNIIEYIFENKEKAKNTFFVSAFISDTDCIVRFNGYIIVKREF